MLEMIHDSPFYMKQVQVCEESRYFLRELSETVCIRRVQRLIPVDSPNELFAYAVPDLPGAKVYAVRPYRASDHKSVYNVCRMTCNDGGEISEVFKEFPDLLPEK